METQMTELELLLLLTCEIQKHDKLVLVKL